jgi:hypothetical protein
MTKKLELIIFGLSLIFLSGCGDGSSVNSTPQTIQGVVIGSHYEGAWVCVDFDSNGVCDGETITVTDANGAWILDDPKDSKLNVVAEIYVDNIKHSNHPAPPSSTLVEKPMIFVAPLKGEVDGQLIVSPISTMVHTSMQENDTSFEVAKESVAAELEVSSDVLLTNYDVENPSPYQTILQEQSAVEIDTLEVTMTYHQNYVKFSAGTLLYSGNYKVEDFYIPSAQDPNHWIKIGTVVGLESVSKDTASLDFVLGRHGSSDVAGWWNNSVHSNQSVYNYEPQKLNFAMRGAFTVKFIPVQYQTEETTTCVFPNLFIAQGHTWDHNNWWIGGPECSYQDKYALSCKCVCEGYFKDYTELSFWPQEGNNSTLFAIGPSDD